MTTGITTAGLTGQNYSTNAAAKTMNKVSTAVNKEVATKNETEDNTVSISEEAKSLYQQNQERLQELYKKQDEESLLEQLQGQKEASDAEAKSLRELSKIMEIARRISNGDKVPGSDERKLMEYSSDLYQAAKAAALMNANKKHKEYESLFEDEDEEQKANDSGEAEATSDTAEQIASIVETDTSASADGGGES